MVKERCKRGHLIAEVGRHDNGNCKACRKLYNESRRVGRQLMRERRAVTLEHNYHLDEEYLRYLWEECPELPAARIADLAGTTRNTVVGRAWRKRWRPRRPEVTTSTMIERLDVLHAAMDAVVS